MAVYETKDKLLASWYKHFGADVTAKGVLNENKSTDKKKWYDIVFSVLANSSVELAGFKKRYKTKGEFTPGIVDFAFIEIEDLKDEALKLARKGENDNGRG